MRDPIRLAFALFGPIILMFAFGYGISFDIENLATAAFDQDETPQSRELLQGFDGLALFLRAAADHIGGRGGAAAQERKHPDRRRSPARFRPRPSQQPHAGSRRDGRRRHDVPRRDGEELCRAASCESRARNCSAKRTARAAPNAWNDDDIETRFRYNQAFLSVNAMVPEHLHADAVPDPGDHVGDRRRAREGDRLDRQFPLDADHPIRVPDRQAAALYRGRDDRFLRSAPDRDFHFPRAAQGAVSRPCSWERWSMSLRPRGSAC